MPNHTVIEGSNNHIISHNLFEHLQQPNLFYGNKSVKLFSRNLLSKEFKKFLDFDASQKYTFFIPVDSAFKVLKLSIFSFKNVSILGSAIITT